MKTSTSVALPALLLVLTGLTGCGNEQEEPGLVDVKENASIPPGFLAGSYEVIGRYPDSEQLYYGTMEISPSDLDSTSMAITRVIGGTSTQGTGSLSTATGDEVQVLRVAFPDEGRAMEATYLIGSDLDNYGRLTGYVYLKEGGTRIPGIEALFHNHYLDR